MKQRIRTILKTFTWMVLVVLITGNIFYFFLGDLGLSYGVAIGIELIEVIVYYFHEVMWNRIKT